MLILVAWVLSLCYYEGTQSLVYPLNAGNKTGEEIFSVSTNTRSLTKCLDSSQIRELVEQEAERTGGIFRLAPTWVGRPGIIVPGRRIKLADIYLSQDVAVNERWLASTTYADNGAYNHVCPDDHGLSYIVIGENLIQLKQALEVCPELMLGSRDKQWDVLPKFFDNWGRIPNHLHPCQKHVKEGLVGKPESYHFPVELNMNRNAFPSTSFGVDPSFTDAQILSYLRRYFTGDNQCTDLGQTINLMPGTGWYTPPCTLHAPGSLVTYELQAASDVTCIPESRVGDMVMPIDLVDRDIPVTLEKDGQEAVCRYILGMLRCDCSGNADNIRQQYFRPPVRIRADDTGRQDYVIYRTGRASEAVNPDFYSAKHSVVYSQSTMDVQERGAFGAIVLGGHGSISLPGKAPVAIESTSIFPNRYTLGGDEFFVTASAAKELRITCNSIENLSLYQHFSSETNPESTSLAIPEFIPFEG